MPVILPRRKFLAGLAAAIAAPAIVRVESLMKLPRPEIIQPFDDLRVPLFWAEITIGGELLGSVAMVWGKTRLPFERDDALRARINNAAGWDLIGT